MRGRPPKPARPVAVPMLTDNPDKIPPDKAVSVLQELSEDDSQPATVRAQAARTLLEMRGLIGRHQIIPGQGTEIVPLSLGTRPELEAELSRLRRQHAAASRVKA
jgi:hypothetical protein